MEVVKGLYNSELDKNRACGFCSYHHAYMTVKQLRCKNCLQKQCHYLVKNEEHKWWKQREEKKQLRKARKAKYA